MFYLVPGLLDQIAKAASFAGAAGTVLHYVLTLAAFTLTIWGFVEIGCLRGTAGSNTYGPDPLLQIKRRGHGITKNEKPPDGRQATGRVLQSRTYVQIGRCPAADSVQTLKSSPHGIN